MGVVESARGILWARRRRPEQVAYAVSLGHERFAPGDLLQQAVEAENAGFDAVCCSDHLAPWWDPGDPADAHCGNAWVWLGAVGHATRGISIGTGVTAVVHRYNPVVVAQQVATLEARFPGRAFLGVGSGEAMNEVPAGMDWPPVAGQLERTEEALRNEAALEGSREWKATLVDDHYTGPVHEPGAIQANGREVGDAQWRAMGLIASDPKSHLRKIKAIEQLGATAIVLMNVSGADPHGALRTYGDEVLPELRKR